MPSNPRVLARPLTVALVAALAIAILPGGTARPVAAASTDLFISEYIEGTSNNKAIEIFNDTGVAVDLAAGAYNIFMSFNGGTSTLTINLTGSVAQGDVYVVANAAASAPILAQADQTNGSGWFNGDDAVALRKGTTNIDVIGQIGFDPGAEWGTGLRSTADNTIRRNPTVTAGDPDGSNAFDPLGEWDGFATDTFGGLGAHPGLPPEPGPTVLSTTPADLATDVAVNTPITVTFSEAVSADADAAAIDCTTATFAPTGDPMVWEFVYPTPLPDQTTCHITITGSRIHDTDTTDPNDTMAADYAFSFTTIGAADPCDSPFTTIPAIQGSGANAAITGSLTTQGVVVGDIETTAAGSGFYLQDSAGDGDAATSDAIFVFTGNTDLVSAGDHVRVTGFARERFTQTTINGSNSNSAAVPAANIIDCDPLPPVEATEVTMPFADATFLERFEGMLVTFPQTLVIAEYFNYDRFGEIVLALPLDGEDRPYTGTAIDEPGAAANARTTANLLRRITLDDNQSAQNPPVLRHPNGDPFSLTNGFRGSDRVTDATGVLGFDFNLYRIFPTAPAAYEAVNPRPTEPDEVVGTVRAAAMNTLNFFLTLDTTASDSGPGPCGGNANLDCRGADADQPDEFTRQRTKLIEALAGLDADVVGLNEIENTPGVEPLLDPERGVVAGLDDLGVGPFDAIDTGPIGTDAIRVGLIYRSDVLAPVGDFAILDSSVDERFIDTKSRPVLAQTFEVIATGARFTVAVNHLKSKGSDCVDVGDPDTGDGQGNCSGTRTLAAASLVDWLASDPTASGDTDVRILGDLNSYATEDPIDAILAGSDDTIDTADDYTNLIESYQGTYAHSYVFDGQAGYLDHALASASMVDQVAGATDWHINADESDVIDYDTSFKPTAQEDLYEPNAYRASDHDPVIVGLDVLSDRPEVDAGGPYEVIEGGTVQVAATGSDPTDDELTYAWDLDDNASFETLGQSVTFDAAALDAPLTVTVTVQVTDEHGQSSTDTAEVRIIWDFGGFQSPANPGGVTQVKAGATLPVKFSLDGPQGMAVLDGDPTFQRQHCQSGADIGPAITAVASEPFAYDVATDTYKFAWKTQKAWAGWCGTLTVALADGESYPMEVRFKP